MKKVISLFLSAMMILTSVLCVNFSAFAQDIESGSIKLGNNTVKASEFVYEDDEVDKTNSTYYWYSFVPDETAVYNFESHYTVSDNTDPVIYLCDKNKNKIANHDDIDDSENRNFRLKASLIKGEKYYLYFQECNDLTSFDFTVDKTKINFSFTLAQKHTLTRGYDSHLNTDNNGDEYDHYYLSNVIYSEGNTITETKEDGTQVTYTCKNTSANEDDEADFSFVDGDGNLFPYWIDYNSAQNRNHLKTGDNVQCYFTIRNDDYDYYNIEVPFTIDIKDFDISGITLNLAQKHTLTQGYDSYIHTDDNGDKYDHYDFWNVIYSEGNTLTVTKKDGTQVTYTCKNTKADEDDEDDFSFVDGDGNRFNYIIDYSTSQSKNHLKPGNNVQCSFRVYNIDVPFTVDIAENPVASIEYIGNITVSDKDKHTYDDGDYYYDYTIYQPGAKIVIHYKNGTSDTYICQRIYDEDDMDTYYPFINVNDSEDWLDTDDYYDYQNKTPWTAGGNNLIYIMCHSVITTTPVTIISSTPVPNPTPNPTPAPSTAPAQQAPAPSTSTSAPAAQITAQPAAPKNNKKVNVASAKAGKKSVKVTWKKVKGIKGYQIQYSTNKKFKKGNKTITVKSTKSTSATIKKLKSKKTYYVRMRTYKIVNGKKVYSAWSKAKSVKVK